MAKIENSKIIDKVVENMSPTDKVLVEGKSGAELLSVFENYPNVQNAFISTLTNKVIKSLIYSKIYENPLKELKKGKLDYGDSIEELFVQMAMAKNFGDNWEDGGTPEADLIRKLKPKVTAMYISTNFDKKYKTTVFDKQLRKAFLNEYGLSNLVMQIVGSITSQAEYQEFLATKAVINDVVELGQVRALDSERKTESKITIPLGTAIKQTPYITKVTDTKDLLKQIRVETGNFGFPSNKYNLAKELNWAKPEDLMLLTTSEIIGDIDVNVLSGAFNVSMAELKTRTIIVDTMPTGIFKGTAELVDKTPGAIAKGNTLTKDDTKEVVAILFDKELTQIWDTHNGAGTFYNPEGQYTNHFANREGIFAVCTFANMVVFYKDKVVSEG